MIRPADFAGIVRPHLRHATPADVPAIVGIEKEAFVDPWDQGIFYEAFRYYPTTCFVALADGALAGFVVGALEDTGENIYGHICNFAVAGRFRHRGIGRDLLRRAEQQFALEGAGGAQLEVRESNLPAQQFYYKNGYRDVFRIGGYYSNGETAVVMMKWFRF